MWILDKDCCPRIGMLASGEYDLGLGAVQFRMGRQSTEEA